MLLISKNSQDILLLITFHFFLFLDFNTLLTFFSLGLPLPCQKLSSCIMGNVLLRLHRAFLGGGGEHWELRHCGWNSRAYIVSLFIQNTRTVYWMSSSEQACESEVRLGANTGQGQDSYSEQTNNTTKECHTADREAGREQRRGGRERRERTKVGDDKEWGKCREWMMVGEGRMQRDR